MTAFRPAVGNRVHVVRDPRVAIVIALDTERRSALIAIRPEADQVTACLPIWVPYRYLERVV